MDGEPGSRIERHSGHARIVGRGLHDARLRCSLSRTSRMATAGRETHRLARCGWLGREPACVPRSAADRESLSKAVEERSQQEPAQPEDIQDLQFLDRSIAGSRLHRARSLAALSNLQIKFKPRPAPGEASESCVGRVECRLRRLV